MRHCQCGLLPGMQCAFLKQKAYRQRLRLAHTHARAAGARNRQGGRSRTLAGPTVGAGVATRSAGGPWGSGAVSIRTRTRSPTRRVEIHITTSAGPASWTFLRVAGTRLRLSPVAWVWHTVRRMVHPEQWMLRPQSPCSLAYAQSKISPRRCPTSRSRVPPNSRAASSVAAPIRRPRSTRSVGTSRESRNSRTGMPLSRMSPSRHSAQMPWLTRWAGPAMGSSRVPHQAQMCLMLPSPFSTASAPIPPAQYRRVRRRS
jgi:hypothetical protein